MIKIPEYYLFPALEVAILMDDIDISRIIDFALTAHADFMLPPREIITT